MQPWQPEHQSKIERPSGFGWVRLAIRLILIATVMFGLLVPLLMARVFGLNALGGRIVQLACKLVIRILGFRLHISGKPLESAGLIVANHSSWLDIFIPNAVTPIIFVAKSEVETWPMIGIFARAVGSEFIVRKRNRAGYQKTALMDRMEQGDRLLMFPEGTSTDGQRILPFRSSLFAALHDEKTGLHFPVQTLTLCYFAPAGKRQDFYGWYGDMGFMESFFETLSTGRNGDMHLAFGAPIDARSFSDRKALSTYLENQVRTRFDAIRAEQL